MEGKLRLDAMLKIGPTGDITVERWESPLGEIAYYATFLIYPGSCDNVMRRVEMECSFLAHDICARWEGKAPDPTGVEDACRLLGKKKVAEKLAAWVNDQLAEIAGVLPGTDPIIRAAQIAAYLEA